MALGLRGAKVMALGLRGAKIMGLRLMWCQGWP
jgi:hypothetical protein